MKRCLNFSLFFLACLFSSSFTPVVSEEISHDKFVIHAIPKCGTHFIQRVIKLLTDKDINHAKLSFNALNDIEKRHEILRIYQDYDTSSINLLKKNGYKVVAMVRDPRDALISFLYHMRNRKGQGQRRDFFTVSSNFDELTFDEQLMALIKGDYGMLSYLTFYRSRVGWSQDPHCLMIKYEDLVGSKGGGDDALQAESVVDIANYLNIELTDAKLEWVLNKMYLKKGADIANDDNNVFTRSSTGNWKKFLKKEHRKAFKKAAGNLLIQLGYEKDNNW